MTSVLIATSQFLATLAYPVKNKIELPVNKKVILVQESIDAVIEVMPILHKASKNEDLAEKFYAVISRDASNDYMRTKRENLHDFLEACGQRTRNEIKESIQHLSLQNLKGDIETVIVNLLDRSGAVVHSTRLHIDDILWSFTQVKEKLLSMKPPAKLPSLLIEHETPAPPKPRRKEKLLVKEGGTRRHPDYNKWSARS